MKHQLNTAEPLAFDAHPRVLVVEARFYHDLAEGLYAGAEAELKKANAEITRFPVAGALEIPQALSFCLSHALANNQMFDAAIVLGCVIRGETSHYEIVSQQSARAVLDIATAFDVPVGNAILTVENMAQAKERANPQKLNKGGEAATAALSLASQYLAFAKQMESA